MTTANVASTDPTRIEIGLTFEDQRSGERRRVVYADEKVVLTRDEAGHTTLTPRDTFASLLGTRYRHRPDAAIDVEVGPLFHAGSTGDDGETADSTHESADGDDQATLTEVGADGGDSADGPETPEEVPFEEIAGIGPETAGALRSTGYVTAADVRRATDEELLGVTGVGPAALEAVREFLD